MTQDTRKDQRAKVLTMTVRYPSATVEDFVEQHSHDVSRGGMFIKTTTPRPVGTLLKFEIKIADEKRLMQGVGRVVWTRGAERATPEEPSGMGVKFIKIDVETKQMIERLMTARGGVAGQFEAGLKLGFAKTGGGLPPRGKSGKHTRVLQTHVSNSEYTSSAIKKKYP